MNLDDQPDNNLPGAGPSAWLCAVASSAAVAGYIAWLTLSDSFSATQAKLHPVVVPQIIYDQARTAAPPWEWNVPLWSILVWLIWLIGTWGGGWVLLRWIWPAGTDTPLSVRAVFAFVMGFCAIGIAQELLGLAGIVAFPLFLLGTVALLLATRRSLALRNELAAFGQAGAFHWRSSNRFTKALIVVAAIAAAFMLIPALTPPIQSDAVRYHLGAPQEYLKLGQIAYLPLNAYSNMPFLVEMHFMATLACRAPEATQLIHFTLALFTVLAIYAAVRLQRQKLLHPSPGLVIAPSLYFFTPMSAILATWPFTDHAISLMLVTNLIAMLLCLRFPGQRHTWAFLGICLGGLIGTKYTMAPIAVVILGTAFIGGLHPASRLQTLRRPFAQAFLAGIICLATGGIWFVKNLVMTGNPFYPLASSIFPGGDWTAVNDKFLHSRAGLKGMGTSAQSFLSLPWNTTFHWVEFETHNPGATVMIGLLITLCGVLACWKAPCLRERLAIIIVIVTSIIAWFFSYQSNRLLLPTLAAALCLTPVSVFAVRPVARYIFSFAVGVACVVGIMWAIQWSWVATALSPPPLPYLLGAQDAATYRYKSLTYARAFDYLNDQVKPDEKVLLIGEHRIYGAKFDAVWSDWFDTPALAKILRDKNITDTQQLLNYLRAQNINWIMINEAEISLQLELHFRPWFSPSEWQIFEEIRILNSVAGIRRVEFPPGVTILHLDP